MKNQFIRWVAYTLTFVLAVTGFTVASQAVVSSSSAVTVTTVITKCSGSTSCKEEAVNDQSNRHRAGKLLRTTPKWWKDHAAKVAKVKLKRAYHRWYRRHVANAPNTEMARMGWEDWWVRLLSDQVCTFAWPASGFRWSSANCASAFDSSPTWRRLVIDETKETAKVTIVCSGFGALGATKGGWWGFFMGGGGCVWGHYMRRALW